MVIKTASKVDPATRRFRNFVIRDRQNRRLLIITTILVVIQFMVFKYFYPFADFTVDSYNYIAAASGNLDINILPIGYSKFLRVFHFFSHSDTALAATQYFALELASLTLFFTILYFYSLSKLSKYGLYVFLFLNPLCIYLSNCLSTECVFAAISIFWVVTLFWILNKPRPNQVIIQAFLALLAFMLRNQAIYYPFIGTLVFILSNQKRWVKWSGPIVSFVLVISFIFFERRASFKMYQIAQFSPMTGWVIANNALHMGRHVDLDKIKFSNNELNHLNDICRRYFKNSPSDLDDDVSGYMFDFFILNKASPLSKYYSLKYHANNDIDRVKDYGLVSNVFASYGGSLIIKHPIPFFRYYVLKNATNYFFPSLETLAVYNLDRKMVNTDIQNWFNYQTPKITSIDSYLQGRILFVFPYLFLFSNILLIGSLVWFITRRKKIIQKKKLKTSLLLLGSILIANLFFSILGNIVILRHQLFPFFISLFFSFLLLDLLEEREAESEYKKLALKTYNQLV